MCGTVDGIIKVSGRRHNCDDLKATILAVDPIKFVYRGRLVVNYSKGTVVLHWWAVETNVWFINTVDNYSVKVN